MGKHDMTGLVVVGGIILVGVMLVSRKATPTPTNGGEMTGAANVQATLGPISLEQMLPHPVRSLTVGAHLVEKVFDSTIQVNFNANLNTTNVKGESISWPYKARVLLGHSTTFGWKKSGELGFSDSGVKEIFLQGQGRIPFLAFFTTPRDPNQEWDIHVSLWGKKSLSDGTPDPNDDYTKALAVSNHDRALKSVEGVSDVSATLEAISVSQGKAKRMGI